MKKKDDIPQWLKDWVRQGPIYIYTDAVSKFTIPTPKQEPRIKA